MDLLTDHAHMFAQRLVELPFSAILSAVCRDVTEALGAEQSALFLYDDVADGFTVAATAGAGLEGEVGRTLANRSETPLGTALEQGRVVLVPAGSVFRGGPPETLRSLGDRPVLLVPLREVTPAGVLAIVHDSRELSADRRSLAERLGHEAANRIEAARPDVGHQCLFQEIVDASPGGIAVVEGADHVISYAAPAFRQMLGREGDPFLGRPLRDVVPAGAPLLALLEDVRATGRARQASQTELRDELGSQYYDVHLIPEARPGGTVTGVFMIVWPRTEVVQVRKTLEAAVLELAESRSTLAAVLDSTNNGIFFVSADLTVLYANRRAGELFGIEPRQIVGQNKLDFIERQLKSRVAEPEDFERRQRHLYQYLEEAAQDEVEVVRPTHRILERYSGPVYDEKGSLMGRIEVYSDVTEVRELQRNKDDFLSVVSHELKTPVTSIKGYAQLLRRRAGRDQLPPQTLAAYDVIERQSARMQQLIDLLLDLSRLQGGRLTLQLGEVDLCRLARETAEMAGMITDGHEIALQLPPEPLVIQGDLARLEQVLMNLLTNGIRYSPDGGTIEVAVGKEGDEAVIQVRDHGVGIPSDALPRIFERFYRAGAVPQATGMGIGLYVTKGIVDEHGGSIAVESNVGQGSIFTVRLPAA